MLSLSKHGAGFSAAWYVPDGPRSSPAAIVPTIQ